jgi:hypothetical protein
VIDNVFPLANAADAHRRMEANLNTGKIVLLPPPDEDLGARHKSQHIA